MADNYEQSTLQPELPKSWFTKSMLKELKEQGWGWEEVPETSSLYFFAEEGFHFYPEEHKREWVEVFQQALKEAKSKLVCTVQSAFYCSKLRPGEFGGHVVVFNKKYVECDDTYAAAARMKKKIERKK